MNVTLKRHFLLSLLFIYAITIFLMRIQGIDLPRQFMVSFPLFSIAFFPPFRFTREKISFTNNQLRLKEGVHLHSEINFEEISSIEGRSLFGVMPILTVSGQNKKQMVLSMKSDGVLDLEESILPRVAGGDKLHDFFRFYRILIQEMNAVEQAMTGWLRFAFLFAIVTPILIWDEGLLPEQMMGLTLIWFAITVASAFFLLLLFSFINRVVLMISPSWAEKNLPFVRAWTLLFCFFGYLVAGHRFCAYFFS